MKVRIVVVGKGEGAFSEVEADYQKRARAFPIEVIELKHHGEDEEARRREGAALLSKIPERYTVIACDERGESLTSQSFAKILSDAQQRSVPGVVFLLGGASGLDPTVKARADKLLSLSALTFPHKLARLVLLEQLYRASSIIRGEPYHK